MQVIYSNVILKRRGCVNQHTHLYSLELKKQKQKSVFPQVKVFCRAVEMFQTCSICSDNVVSSRPFCHSPAWGFMLGSWLFFPAEVPSWSWREAEAWSEGSSGLSLNSTSGFNISMMQGLRWGPSSSYRNLKVAMRSSSDMLRASLAWMMPMFHWARCLRGIEGAPCRTGREESRRQHSRYC